VSLLALGRVIASQPREGTVRAAGTRPTAQQLLTTIGAYIPTDVTTLWIAAAGGMATLTPQPPQQQKLFFIVVMALAAGFATWVIGHRALTSEYPSRTIKPIESLRYGWYEIPAAGVGFFVWATAMPASWYEFGTNAIFVPGLWVGIATFLIGGLATLLNRDKRSLPAPTPPPPPPPAA
jgi:hypothetical protein